MVGVFSRPGILGGVFLQSGVLACVFLMVGVLAWIRGISDLGSVVGNGGIFFLIVSLIGAGRWGDLVVLNLGC